MRGPQQKTRKLPIKLSKINVLGPKADHREAAADNDAK